MAKHYVGETGTDLILDTGILVGSATEKYIKYKSPSGLSGTWTASFYSTYSLLGSAIGTYFLKHTLTPTDLTVPGEWRFQAYVAAIDGTWFGEMVKINIYDAFE